MTEDDLQSTLRPILSLTAKSEKALAGQSEGTWQHKTLSENISALRIASALMRGEPPEFAQDALQKAANALSAMIVRTQKPAGKFAAGTSRRTLLDNRLNALRVAETVIAEKLQERSTDDRSWLTEVKAKLKRGNKVLFSRDCVLFCGLNGIMALESHKALTLWAFEAASSAVDVLRRRYPDEPRPRIALDTSRAWAAGETKMRQAQRAILDCHAFAKDITSPIDAALCHAVGQACGVVHAKGHAVGFPMYELTALVHSLGADSCARPVEERVAFHIERIAYWSGHIGEYQGTWAGFMEDDM